MKKLLISIIILLSINLCFSQSQLPQHRNFRISIPQQKGTPTNINITNSGEYILEFSDLQIELLFSSFNVYKFEKEFPTSTTPLLQTIYEIETDDIQLMTNLINDFSNVYPIVEEIPTALITNTPNDFGITGGAMIKDFAKELMRLELAWDITTGDPNILIGITDNGFDLNHVDLSSQIVTYFGPVIPTGNLHGTKVAGCAAAATNNNIGITGNGYSCKLLLDAGLNINNMLELSQNGAKVINASFVTGCTYSQVDQLVMDEMYNNGTVVVAGAGNGLSTSNQIVGCGPNDLYYPASYDHVISVSSVGSRNNIGFVDPVFGKVNWKDCHEQLIGDLSTTHTHNSEVDLVAPGYQVLSTADGNQYAEVWGTSFASPFVAGIAGLILSINPCLDPDEVETILKTSANNIYLIAENAGYIGQLGAGRVDAFDAVILASQMAQGSNIQLTMSSTDANCVGPDGDGTATANVFLGCGGGSSTYLFMG